MKKLLTILLALSLLTCSVLYLTACEKGTEQTTDVYMPDGAPALSMAQLMSEDNQFDTSVRYHVVDANSIKTYVTGETPDAELCVLPINLAAQLLGQGDVYRMLGTVTHGNIYFLSAKFSDSISNNNLSSLIGKTVGCIQLENVVGLTLRLVLADHDIAYEIVESVDAAQEGVVNLINIGDPATMITPAAEFDYMVAAEPIVTTKVVATDGLLKQVGDLQKLYGEGGYPQAVLVAKSSFIDANKTFINSFVEAVTENAEWLMNESTDAETIAAAISANLPDGATPTFKAQNLNKTVIGNCAIRFENAADSQAEVVQFLQKLSLVSGNNFAVDEKFFYIG